MRQFFFLTVALLIGAAQASAQTGSGAEAEIENLAVTQLCEMQGDPDAVAELERRDLFSKRELRAIRREKARSRISLEALECAIGMPERTALNRAVPGSEQSETYFYALPDAPDLMVSVSIEDGQLIVMDVVEPRIVRSKTPATERFPWTSPHLSSSATMPWYGSGRDDVDLQQPEWDSTPWQQQWSTDSLLKRWGM